MIDPEDLAQTARQRHINRIRNLEGAKHKPVVSGILTPRIYKASRKTDQRRLALTIRRARTFHGRLRMQQNQADAQGREW